MRRHAGGMPVLTDLSVNQGNHGICDGDLRPAVKFTFPDVKVDA